MLVVLSRALVRMVLLALVLILPMQKEFILLSLCLVLLSRPEKHQEPLPLVLPVVRLLLGPLLVIRWFFLLPLQKGQTLSVLGLGRLRTLCPMILSVASQGGRLLFAVTRGKRLMN